MKAGVAIDSWKLDIFKKHLDAAGYKYDQGKGVTSDTLMLYVQYTWLSDLKPIIEAAERECQESKA